MLMAIHAPVGAIIGESVANPLWAFILALISHFLLDIIPHGDLELINKYEKKQTATKTVMNYIIIDAILTIFMVLLIFQKSTFVNTNAVVWGIIGSLLPDLLVGLYEVTNSQILKPIKELHHRNHLLIKKDFNHLTGWILQLIVLLLIIIVII